MLSIIESVYGKSETSCLAECGKYTTHASGICDSCGESDVFEFIEVIEEQSDEFSCEIVEELIEDLVW